MSISGLGPHGERAAPPERVALLPQDIAAAQGLRVAVVMHTLQSDWAQQCLSGIVGTFGDCGMAVIEVVDCGFDAQVQVAALDRLILEAPDAIISLPVGNAVVAQAHARVAAAGIKLVLLDNVPTGLLPGKDYATLVSADNFGLGKIAAESLADHMPQGAEVGLLGYDADFFATNEREIAFRKCLQLIRPDVIVHQIRFAEIAQAGAVVCDLAARHPELSGIFVVWDTPAIAAETALKAAGRTIPMVTVDLGREAAISLAGAGAIVAIAAQQPFRQGVAVAQTTILALLGRSPPAWIALPGIAVTAANVVESFQTVWRMPAPREVLLCRKLVRRP